MPRFLTIAGETPASDRGREREAAILEAAEQEFLEHGYGATTIDAIAKRAGGSKSTLYRFFPNKAALFHAVVASVVADRRKVDLDPKAEIYDSLYEYCIRRLRVVFRRRHWSLLRLIMAERDRFPAIAQAYYELGPQHGLEVLSEYFSTLSQLGRLELIADPMQTAKFFIGMLMHDWYLKHMVTPGKLPTREQQETHAKAVVKTFLAATMPKESETSECRKRSKLV
jgi:AcrR family transcriptional regulator